MFGPKPYERAAVWAEAEKARGKGNRKKAVAAYRRILEHEPDDWQVHGKLAPLLVDEDPFEAWNSFEKAAQGHLDKGFVDRALGVYRQAMGALPFIPEGWEKIAALYQRKGHAPDAVKALVDGQRHFWKTPEDRVVAERFLNAALSLDAWNVDATLALAQLLKRRKDVAGAVAKLDALLAHLPTSPAKKRVLRARLAVSFTLRHLWAWLRGR
ncbi:MAG: hypothetical protein AB1938_14290 [Myxococcota bacterium]